MPPPCQLRSRRLIANCLTIRTAQYTQRTFASVTPAPPVKNPLQKRRGGDLGSHLPKHVIPQDAYIPPYPYGPSTLFKQADRGLYGGQMIQFGNNVSSKTETKTRRHWKPNVLSKSLYSVALKKRIKMRITAKVLKIMDREGGLDEYLLKDSEARIKELGPMGWALRWTVMQRPEVIARLRAEAAALGLDQATIDKQWPTVEIMAKQGVTQISLDHLDQEEFDETEGQEMWDPAEDQAFEEVPRPTILSKQDKIAREIALTEYAKVTGAASRYLSRGVVASREDGIKLAFIRARERKEARLTLQNAFNDKIARMFSDQDIQNLRSKLNLPPYLSDRAAREIAYNQQKRQEIAAAGGLEAWKAAKYGEKAAAHKAKVEAEGGTEARKAHYVRMIEEAETATDNSAIDSKERNFLNAAMRKAKWAIRAMAGGGQEEYAQDVIKDLRIREARLMSSGNVQAPRAKHVGGVSEAQSPNGGDAWALLVAESNRSVENEKRV